MTIKSLCTDWLKFPDKTLDYVEIDMHISFLIFPLHIYSPTSEPAQACDFSFQA